MDKALRVVTYELGMFLRGLGLPLVLVSASMLLSQSAKLDLALAVLIAVGAAGLSPAWATGAKSWLVAPGVWIGALVVIFRELPSQHALYVQRPTESLIGAVLLAGGITWLSYRVTGRVGTIFDRAYCKELLLLVGAGLDAVGPLITRVRACGFVLFMLGLYLSEMGVLVGPVIGALTLAGFGICAYSLFREFVLTDDY